MTVKETATRLEENQATVYSLVAAGSDYARTLNDTARRAQQRDPDRHRPLRGLIARGGTASSPGTPM